MQGLTCDEYHTCALGIIQFDSSTPACSQASDAFIASANKLFYLFDSNGDGQLDTEEVGFMNFYGIAATGREVYLHDHVNKVPNITEFLHLLFHNDTILQVIDGDNDGRISSYEIAKVLQNEAIIIEEAPKNEISSSNGLLVTCLIFVTALATLIIVVYLKHEKNFKQYHEKVVEMYTIVSSIPEPSSDGPDIATPQRRDQYT